MLIMRVQRDSYAFYPFTFCSQKSEIEFAEHLESICGEKKEEKLHFQCTR